MNVFENVCQGLRDEDLRRARQARGAAAGVRGPWRTSTSTPHVRPDEAARASSRAACASGWAWPGPSWASPEIILYDEPVTGLDPVNAATVNSLIVADRREDEGHFDRGHPRHRRAPSRSRTAWPSSTTGSSASSGLPPSSRRSEDPAGARLRRPHAPAAAAALKIMEEQVSDDKTPAPGPRAPRARPRGLGGPLRDRWASRPPSSPSSPSPTPPCSVAATS